MSKRVYPYLYQVYKQKPDATKSCELCDKRATHRAEFQYSWFRADDEQTFVCEEHLSIARSDPKTFHAMLAAGRAKEKKQ